jgi:hypothetical protein
MTTTIPARGWYVEVDHPSGYTWRPDVVGEPTPQPTIDGYPRLTIPVRASDRWSSSDFDDQPLRVWFDGVRQPVDKVETPTVTEEGWELEGRGATELDTNVRKEVDVKEAHVVAEEVITNNTPYTANIDSPDNTVEQDVELLSADSQSEWQDALSIADTAPVSITTDGPQLEQTAWIEEGEAVGGGGGAVSVSGASADEAEIFLTSGDDVTLNFTPQYDIPAGKAVPLIRIQPTDTSNTPDTPGFVVEIDGTTVIDRSTVGSYGVPGWTWLSASNVTTDAPALSAGSSTSVRIELVNESANSDLYVDIIGVGDNRRPFNLPSSISGRAATPQEYAPESVDTEDIAVARSVTAGRLSSTYDDTSNAQQVAISNDQGQTYQTASNSEIVDAAFDSPSTQIRGQLTLDGYGERTGATPTTGYLGQSVDSFSLFADLDDTPLLVNQTFDDNVADVLTEITPAGTHWQAVRDGDSYSIEYTEGGQRTTDEQPDTTAFEYSRRVEDVVDKVRVKGSVIRVRDERITADPGTAVSLSQDDLVHGRETVYDPDTDTEYVEGEDYSLRAQPGEIVALSSGAIADGQTIAVDYGYRPVGESPTTVTEPELRVETIPGLTTDRACTLAAIQIAETLSDPLEEGTVTVATDKTDWSLLESRKFAAIPTDGVVDIHDATPSAAGTELRVGTRQPYQEVIDDIRRQLSAVEKRS